MLACTSTFTFALECVRYIRRGKKLARGMTRVITLGAQAVNVADWVYPKRLGDWSSFGHVSITHNT